MSCDRITRLASSGGLPAPPPTNTAAEVSSHEVSMPRTTSATAAPAPHDEHRIGDGARGDAAGGEHHEAYRRRVGDRTGEVHDHLEAVLGEGLDGRFRAAHHHRGPG